MGKTMDCEAIILVALIVIGVELFAVNSLPLLLKIIYGEEKFSDLLEKPIKLFCKIFFNLVFIFGLVGILIMTNYLGIYRKKLVTLGNELDRNQILEQSMMEENH
jgi:hypothetical protein